MEMSGQLHATAVLSPGNEFGTHSVGGWVDPKADLELLENINFVACDGNRILDSATRSVLKTGVQIVRN
jgi:hypothetical protein